MKPQGQGHLCDQPNQVWRYVGMLYKSFGCIYSRLYASVRSRPEQPQNMDEEHRRAEEKWIKEMIAEELASQGDVLPPWRKHPEIKRRSIGWRMGYGQSYMMAWDWWASQMKEDQLIEYFKKYLPIPLEWLDWVAYRCKSEDYDWRNTFACVQWLEQQGLANLSEFMAWYEQHR